MTILSSPAQVLETITFRVKPGNAVAGNCDGDNRSTIRDIIGHAPIPSPPDRLSHRGNRGDAVSARRAGPDRRRLRLRGATAAGPAREAKGVGVCLGGHSENPQPRTGPRARLLGFAG